MLYNFGGEMKKSMLLLFISLKIGVAQDAKILFYEGFEDANFAQRGWYDHLEGEITNDEKVQGSNYSLEFKFLFGESTPTGGTPGRHLFDETDQVCVSFYVKYSSNYIGSNQPYHPHEFYLLTNMDGEWVGPAFTHLTAYIEQNAGCPLLAIQDGENIDQSRIGENLVGITEERGVAGCNGSSDGYPDDCYDAGGLYVNGKMWKANFKYFSDQTGQYYKNDWHYIEAYFQLNRIQDGKGIADGVLKYWYDNELIIEYNDVLFRTAEHPDLKFNQFLLAPYIGDGSPIEQIMWIDDLTVSTSRIVTGITENNASQEKYLFPNPASNYIYVSQTAHAAASTIEIFNALGESIFVSYQNISSSGGQLQIDVSQLPAGVYCLKMGNKVDKFVVMR